MSALHTAAAVGFGLVDIVLLVQLGLVLGYVRRPVRIIPKPVSPVATGLPPSFAEDWARVTYAAAGELQADHWAVPAPFFDPNPGLRLKHPPKPLFLAAQSRALEASGSPEIKGRNFE